MKQKEPVPGRPSVKEALCEMLREIHNHPTEPAVLYEAIVEKYGYWSRQSVFNALKDERVFAPEGAGFRMADLAPHR